MHTSESEMDNLLSITDETARNMLLEMLEHKSTVQVEKELGVNRGLIPYVLNGGHSPTMLHALGLPVYEQRPVPVCMNCGKIHKLLKTCRERPKRTRYRMMAEMRNDNDLHILDMIAKNNGCTNWTDFCRSLVDECKRGTWYYDIDLVELDL